MLALHYAPTRSIETAHYVSQYWEIVWSGIYTEKSSKLSVVSEITWTRKFTGIYGVFVFLGGVVSAYKIRRKKGLTWKQPFSTTLFYTVYVCFLVSLCHTRTDADIASMMQYIYILVAIATEGLDCKVSTLILIFGCVFEIFEQELYKSIQNWLFVFACFVSNIMFKAGDTSY